jgi:aryl-alcohol dehydrogenase-like predicted oxidoreductase
VATIDVYYLHNPETQLGAVSRPEFLERMRQAFEFLEGEVRAGTIRRYGAATWQGFRQPPSSSDHLSLGELCALATEVAGPDHHFRVVQLPYNLAMTEAFTADTQVIDGEAMPLLEAARRLGMYCMASASMHQGQLVRGLPPMLGELLPGLRSDAQRALQFVRSTPGVGTALVGMKRRAHVDEVGRLCGVAPVAWGDFQRLFQAG